MVDFLKKLIYNKEEETKPESEIPEGDWVECQVCGFRGTLADFTILDSQDTICPKCKQDDQVFEI